MIKVSVVIPTYNRLPRLQQVLAGLERQQYPLDNIEVVVISDGSTDGTDAYFASVKSPLNLHFVHQTNSGPAAARNAGIHAAQGEYILFIDDDVVPTPQMLSEHMRQHELRDNRVVLGPMLNPPDFQLSPWVSWEQAMLEKQYKALLNGTWEATARQFYTGNTSLRRQILLDSGGFDERFRRAEDIELAYRLEEYGVEFCFTMTAVGLHYAERSFQSWLQTPYSYGRYDIVFSRERHAWLLSFVRNEFMLRNRLIRLVVWLFLDRPRLSRSLIAIAKWVADSSYQHSKKQIAQAGYSAIFNLRYYQGIADELGGRKHFFDDVKPATGNPAAS
jgi:glycosyltransferase involved in cell wall biosynthesis